MSKTQITKTFGYVCEGKQLGTNSQKQNGGTVGGNVQIKEG